MQVNGRIAERFGDALDLVVFIEGLSGAGTLAVEGLGRVLEDRADHILAKIEEVYGPNPDSMPDRVKAGKQAFEEIRDNIRPTSNDGLRT